MKTATIMLMAASLAALTTGLARSQPPETPPACSAEIHDDFDFWLGDWNVYAPDNGPYQGHNSIRKVNGDCLITEHWTGASGTVGDSMNFHDPVTGAWRQVWVSPGWYIDYQGGLDADGAMVLTGQSHTLASGQTAAFRGTWTPNDDGTVSQFFEQQDAEGNWVPAFLGIYVRVDRDPRAAEAAEARGE